MLDRQKQIVDNMLGLTKNTWDVMKLQMEFGRARSTSVQSAEAAFTVFRTQAADIRRQIVRQRIHLVYFLVSLLRRLHVEVLRTRVCLLTLQVVLVYSC